MSLTKKATTQSFDQDVLKSQGPVLVDFWAEWCGPCRALAPVLEEVAKEIGAGGTVIKVNIDENSELAQRFGIKGIPTMMFFKDGEVKKTLVGNQPKAEILSSFKTLL